MALAVTIKHREVFVIMRKLIVVTILVAVFSLVGSVQAAVSSFEDLSLAPDSYWNGSDGSGGFQSGNAYFYNSYTDWGGGFYSWYGFAYSNMTDTTTPGYGNQFSAITGGGVNGSDAYAISYNNLDYAGGTYDVIPNTVFFMGADRNTTISGVYVTNTTLTYYAIKDGIKTQYGYFPEPFGEGDYFKLLIQGIDQYANLTEPVEFYLADYTSDNQDDWYIVNTWEWVDLTSLGNIIGLTFTLESSDVSASFGMNTPAYFALDDLNGAAPVPIPGALWLLGSGLIGLVGLKRKSK